MNLQLTIPTEDEIKQLIANGAKCPVCKKKPAELTMIIDIYAVGPCHLCQEKEWKEKKKRPKSGKYYNPDRVYSVWTAPNGEQIAVNEGGNVINPVHAKYERKKGEKPLF